MKEKTFKYICISQAPHWNPVAKRHQKCSNEFTMNWEEDSRRVYPEYVNCPECGGTARVIEEIQKPVPLEMKSAWCEMCCRARPYKVHPHGPESICPTMLSSVCCARCGWEMVTFYEASRVDTSPQLPQIGIVYLLREAHSAKKE